MTSYDAVVPINFSVSDSVATLVGIEILAHGFVPCVAWAVTMTPNGDEDEGAPTLGGYEQDQVPAGALRRVNGIDVVFALTPETKLHFDNMVLDYEVDRGLSSEIIDLDLR